MHTPGPWEVESGMVQTVLEHKCKLKGCGVHIPIAYMDRTLGNGTLPVERDDNARLIAKAPEMLAFIREFESTQAVGFWCEHETGEPKPGCKHCLALIARALLREIKV